MKPRRDDRTTIGGKSMTHPRPVRRSQRLYRIAHVGIVAYLLAAGAVVLFDPSWLATRWLALHLVFLGAVSTAIVVWSSHFAQALTRDARGDRWLGLRLLHLNAGVVLVLGGIAPVSRGTAANVGTAAGVGIVAVAVATHAVVVARMARGVFGGPLRRAAWYYVVAAGSFLLAAPLGAALATGQPKSLAGNSAATTVHVHLNVFGWVGLTVLGTLLTLWPAALRVRMDPRTPRMMSPVLAATGIGLVFIVLGLWAGADAIAAVGLGLYVAAVVALFVPLVIAGRRSRVVGGPALAMAFAAIWFTVYLTLDLIAVARDGVAGALNLMTTLIPVLAVGFLGQILVGALTFLLPVVLGGGPAGHKRLARLLGRWWIVRIAATNVGLVLAAALDGSSWATLGWVLAGAGIGSFLPLVIIALIPPSARSRVLNRIGSHGESTSRSVWTAAVLSAPLLILGGAIAVVPSGGDGAPVPAASTGDQLVVDVSLTDFRVEPARLEVPAGADVLLRVRNDGVHNHDLRVDGVGGTRILRAGEVDELYLGQVGETLSGWCTVGGHRRAGMEMEIDAL